MVYNQQYQTKSITLDWPHSFLHSAASDTQRQEQIKANKPETSSGEQADNGSFPAVVGKEEALPPQTPSVGGETRRRLLK